jgi:hypothetical protein
MAGKKAKAKKERGKTEKGEEVEKGNEETGSLPAEEIETKEKKRQEMQIGWIVFWLVLFIAFTISFILLYRNAGTFIYNGMKFQRVNMEGLTLYKTTLQFTRPDGSFKFDLYLRNNPKDLEGIPVSPNATITLRRGGFVSFEPRISGCYGSNVAAYELGAFLGALGMLVRGATTDKNLSEEKALEWRVCNQSALNTVIVLTSNNRSSIEYDGYNCYTLNIANCDAIAVSEKFILETALQMLKKSDEKINSNNK